MPCLRDEIRAPSTEAADDGHFIPARKFGSEEEMGGTVLYLASRAASVMDLCFLMMGGD